MQVKEIRDKSIETCLEKYDTDNPSKNEEIKNKILQTFRDKFGCDNPMQVEEIKLKSIEKSVDHYIKMVVFQLVNNNYIYIIY